MVSGGAPRPRTAMAPLPLPPLPQRPLHISPAPRFCITKVALLIFAIAASNAPAAVHSYQHMVGDLDCWGMPPPSKSDVYSVWSQKTRFQIGDSLMFLYPPSQDNVAQVTESAFGACDASAPLLHMSDGNSVFNLTTPGIYYFTSSVSDRCAKHQKLAVTVLNADGSAPLVSADTPSGAPGGSGSFPLVFGPTAQPSAARSARGSASAGSWAVAFAAVAATGWPLVL